MKKASAKIGLILAFICLIFTGLLKWHKSVLLDEAAELQWEGYEFEYFRNYPSVQWKQLNLAKLKKQNLAKLNAEVEKLQEIFS